MHPNPDTDAFVEAALSNAAEAREMLAANPEIARAGFHAALVSGDVPTARQSIDTAAQTGGPRNWQPLLYVCFSRLRAPGLIEIARLLLQHGADPNASYNSEEWPDNPFSCLSGATGVNNNPALAKVLLEAGADPNDSESLYHSTEHPDLACMQLLLANGALPSKANALKHLLDYEHLTGVQLLLNAGADPNERNGKGETALHWAVWRRRSPEIITLLLDRGASIDAQRNDGRTAYALAVQSCQTHTAALLQTRGASTELSAIDRFLAAAADTAPAPPPDTSPANRSLLPDLASAHRTSAVRALLAAGWPIDARGELGATALHWACWKGYADLVSLLLEHGASTTMKDEQYGGTPAGWFDHGRENCRQHGGEDRGDYAAVASILRERGLLT